MEAEKGFGERYRTWIECCTLDPHLAEQVWQEILRHMEGMPLNREAQASGKTPREDGIQ